MFNDILLCAGCSSTFSLWLNGTKDAVCFKYNDGTREKTLAVALASARFTHIWLKWLLDVPNLTNYPNGGFKLREDMTDAEMNAVGFNDAATAASNTQVIAAYAPESWGDLDSAAKACRNKKINGQKCALPNIQQLKRIWVLRKKIDALDPSTSGYKLSNWGGEDFAWASTEFNAQYAWLCESDGAFNNLQIHAKNLEGLVIPVLEL